MTPSVFGPALSNVLDGPARHLLDGSPVATAAIDPRGAVVYANAAFAALLAAPSPGALLGTVPGLEAPDGGPAPLGLWRGLAPGGARHEPLVVLRPDGSRVAVCAAVHRADGPPGDDAPTWLSLLARDEPRPAADAHAPLSDVVRAAGVVILGVDADGRIVRVDGDSDCVLGHADEALLRRTLHEVIAGGDAAPHAAEATRRMLADGAPPRLDGLTTELPARDGRPRVVEWTLTRMPLGRPGAPCLIAVGVDASPRREAEHALARSRSRLQQFQQMIERSPQEVWIVGPDARIRYVNAAGAASLGYRPEELVGRPAAEVDAGGQARVEASLDAAATAFRHGHASIALEVEHLARDGRRIRKEILAILIEIDGEPLGAMFANDITERTRQQAARAEYARILGTTLDLFPGWVACVDDDRRYLYANETFAADRGLERASIVGRSVAEIRGDDVARKMADLMVRLREGERIDHSRQITDARGESRTFWMSYRAQRDPLHPDRHVYLAFGVDVTEARRNERRLDTVLGGTSTGIWEWSGRTGRLWVNPQFPALVGARREDANTPMIEMVRSWVNPEDRPSRKAKFRELVEGKIDGLDDEFRVRHANGSWIWLHERVHVVARAADGRPLKMTGMLQDVTARKLQERQLHELNAALEARVAERTGELEAATARAERASAAKTEFLSRMSHELRTPLNAILGFSQLLGMSTLPEGQSDTVAEILHAGRHLLALIDEVLDLATVESGGVHLQSGPIRAAELVDECLALFRPDVLQARLRVENRVDAAGPPVLADRMRLRQVLLNLLSNAVKYNRPDGTLVVSSQQTGSGGIELRVTDGGRGLTPDQVARLFKPFERLDAKRGSIPGTGIGLAVSRRLVELMGGTIGVVSEPGSGSTFWVRLPLAEADASMSAGEIAAPPAPSSAPALADYPRRRVLYVEDNVSNQRLMRHLLQMRPDVELEVVGDPRNAVDRARAGRPDLVLLDIQLPYIDGYGLLQAMRAAGVAAPIVAVSANAMPEDVARGAAAGFAAYLTKPLDVRRVLEVVGEQLGS